MQDEVVPGVRVPKYLSRRTTAMVEKGQLKIQEAAILLLKCVWQHEKETWDTPAFCIISDCGLLDLTTIHEIYLHSTYTKGKNKKGLRGESPKSLIYLVAGEGFEPTTFGL
ncbi:MAG: hypothetical protein BA873_10760 [Desulfobulbaceae bacterium C00003063]|nr:MAG: hypothetical protein BA873_10760 [Desulfobulbaceae bacterium C00003063]